MSKCSLQPSKRAPRRQASSTRRSGAGPAARQGGLDHWRPPRRGRPRARRAARPRARAAGGGAGWLRRRTAPARTACAPWARRTRPTPRGAPGRGRSPWPAGRPSPAMRAMPSTSSSVSPGRPIMKYSLSPVNPPSNVARTASSNCASSTPLLMASRSAWRPRLGRERERAALVGGEARQALGRRVDAQRRQRDAQAGAQLADARERLRDAAVVARAEREQRDLVAAGLVEQPVGGLDHQVHRPLPHRPVPHARLAEAAAGGAAAHDLDDDAVVDRLEHRDDRAQHGLARREPHEDLPLGRPALPAGHPHAGDGRQRPQARLAAVLLHRRDDRVEVILRPRRRRRRRRTAPAATGSRPRGRRRGRWGLPHPARRRAAARRPGRASRARWRSRARAAA